MLEHGRRPRAVEHHAYELREKTANVMVDGRPLIFLHYHSLRLYSGITEFRRLGFLARSYNYSPGANPLVWRTGYPLDGATRSLLWEPYVQRVGEALGEIRRLEPGFKAGFERLEASRLISHGLRRRMHALSERLPGRFAMSRRHVDTWRGRGVAQQMCELAESELANDGAVRPFAAFVETITALIRDFPLPEQAAFLDFGCGVGQYSELLERHFPGRFNYTGCDYSQEMITVARTRWPGRTFLVNDVFDNKIDLGDFDIVFASALVDVLPEYERALDILLGAASPYVVLHRQRVTADASLVGIAQGYSGQKTYRTMVNLEQLTDIADRHGRTLARQFPVDDDMQTFLFTRITR